MAHKCAFFVMLCVCLSAVGIAIWAQISQKRMAVSLEELKAENNRLNRARIEALGEVDFLRDAMRRLDASVKAANEALDRVEVRYYDRQNSIESAPVEWRTDSLPAGVCDAFAGYVLPAAAACSDSPDAAVPAARD